MENVTIGLKNHVTLIYSNIVIAITMWRTSTLTSNISSFRPHRLLHNVNQLPNSYFGLIWSKSMFFSLNILFHLEIHKTIEVKWVENLKNSFNCRWLILKTLACCCLACNTFLKILCFKACSLRKIDCHWNIGIDLWLNNVDQNILPSLWRLLNVKSGHVFSFRKTIERWMNDLFWSLRWYSFFACFYFRSNWLRKMWPFHFVSSLKCFTTRMLNGRHCSFVIV